MANSISNVYFKLVLINYTNIIFQFLHNFCN